MNGRKDFPVYSAKAAICVLCSAVFLLGPTERAEAANITNYLKFSWNSFQCSIAVNVGDTVVWVNQWPQQYGTNYVESYGGEWKSPPLNTGDSFSFTFTNAGFYAYRTRPGSQPGVGTVTVIPWMGAPPAVTINIPVDGSVLPWSWGSWVQASVTNTEDLAQIEYFSNSILIGTATNASYAVWWNAPQQGPHVLVAKATDRQGKVNWSPPVNVTAGRWFDIWGSRLLPTGELLFFYTAIPTQTSGHLAASDEPIFPRNVCSRTTYTNWSLGEVQLPGVFVDESVRGGTVQLRFYSVVSGTSGVCP